MEQKCLKTPVYINDTIFNESCEQPIDVDFILPDYCPDISKILKCRAVSRISSKGINGRSVTVDGTVCITVMYADAEGLLRSFEYLYPFSKTLELSVDCKDGNLCCKTKCEYINCRAVTGRKLDIHGAAGIYCRIFRRKATDIIADIDDANIELKRGNAPATTPMGCSEKYLLIEEEIEIGQGQPPIRSLIRYDACAAVKESKILNDKIVVKGDLTVSTLYCPEDGTAAQVLKTVIPFSQILDMEGITEACECETSVDVAFIELKARTSASGDARSFLLNAKLLVTSEAYCNNDIPVILDAYSRRYKANIIKKEICFDKITETINEVYNCKKNLDFPEGAISSVADLWCDTQHSAARAEGQTLIVSGTVVVGMIVYDTQEIACYYERPIDFEYRYELKCAVRTLHCEPQLEVLSAGYTITGESAMELRIELSINASVYETDTVPLIVDMEIDHEQQLEKKTKGAMTIYYADAGESIWGIARKYNAAVDEVMQVNELDKDILESNRMILIPIV